MAEFKANVGDPKTGKTYKQDIIGDEAKHLLGKKIGDKVKGDKIGFSGYEFEITGGSDSSGFPMRKDVSGTMRKKVLIASGVGTRHNRKGMRLRRRVAANTIHAKTSQINMKTLTYGKKALDAESPKEEAPAEAPKEEKTEEKKEKPPKEEAKAEETPKEEIKAKEKAPKEVSETKVSDDAQKPKVSDKAKEKKKEEPKKETTKKEKVKEEKAEKPAKEKKKK
ncbi:MAG: 30S ribosomal protein S6e [Nanoarchaeota archaeon]|nr:30S ribosomal protein S6e [DPANN group archaeon]MBL7117019.1 30S ribosomal protein S6e [Nanoarchaeota archaeon]